MHPIVDKFNRSKKAPNTWKDGAVMPLARLLAREKGLLLYFMGPFGIRAACTIILYADRHVEPLKQEHWSITIMPHFGDTGLELRYDTYRVIHEYPPGSIGALNNMGNEQLPLPDTTKEILALMKHSEGIR